MPPVGCLLHGLLKRAAAQVGMIRQAFIPKRLIPNHQVGYLQFVHPRTIGLAHHPGQFPRVAPHRHKFYAQRRMTQAGLTFPETDGILEIAPNPVEIRPWRIVS